MPNGFDVNQFRQQAGASSAGIGGDTVSESSSWGAQLGQSIKGMLFGLVLVPVSCLAIFFFEGMTIDMASALKEAGAIVQEADALQVDPALDGRLVHVAGTVPPGAVMVDETFGVTARGLKLVRHVEMLQWRENQQSENSDAGRRTVFRYTKDWSANPVNSASFRVGTDGQSHANPPMPVRDRLVDSQGSRIGAYVIEPSLLAALPEGGPYPLSEAVATKAAETLGRPARLFDGGIFVGVDAANPAVGDLRLSFTLAAPEAASAMARQQGGSLAPYLAASGSQIALLRPGLVPAAALLAVAGSENSKFRWMARLGGIIFVWLGFFLLLRPLAVLVDAIPVLGWIIATGTSLAALVLTVLLVPLVIALAWLWHAPIFSLLLIGGAMAVAALLRFGTLAARGALSR